MTNEDRVLLEDMNGKLDAILEGQEAMGHMPGQLRDMDSRLERIESEVTGMKAAMRDEFRDSNKKCTDIDKRVTRLEQSAT